MIYNFSDSEKAEECYKEAVGLCEDTDYELFLVYGALLVQNQKKDEALIFLKASGSNEDNPAVYTQSHILMSLLYADNDNEELKDKHLALASRMQSRQKEGEESI